MPRFQLRLIQDTLTVGIQSYLFWIAGGMTMRYTLLTFFVSASLLSGCASSPYLDSPWWLSAENSPVWTAEQRVQFFESINPGETTLGDVVEMYGPAMTSPTDTSGGQVITTMFWYGETGLDQPWAAIDIPGDLQAWNDNSPVLAVYTSEGMKKVGSADAKQETGLNQGDADLAKKPLAVRKQPIRNSESSSKNEFAPVVQEALADGVIGPNEIVDELAVAMAAFGKSGGTVSSFRSRFGPEAEYQEDRRFFRKVGSTLFYGSEYGEGPSVWVEFHGDDQYYSTIIHVPRGDGTVYQRSY